MVFKELFGGGDDVNYSAPVQDESSKSFQESIFNQDSDAQSNADSASVQRAGQGLLSKYGGDSLSKAISNRAGAKYGMAMGNIGTKQEFLNDANKFGTGLKQFEAAKAVQNIKNKNNEMLTQAYQQNTMARAQVIKNMMGTAGMLAGMAIGGPAGAQVGGSIMGGGKDAFGSNGPSPGNTFGGGRSSAGGKLGSGGYGMA